MAERCLVCARELGASASGETHAACSRRLFGSARVPAIELDPEHLYLFGQQMAGRVTLSGVQSKVSLGWHQKTLRVRAEESSFILKPRSGTYPELPENEHVCMLLAAEAGLDVAITGLVRLSNGSLALVVRRFDREKGRRLAMEDLCQLGLLLPREKYTGSAELCARLVRRFAAEPGVDLLRLFRQTLFSWWIGNGDLHLKNLALLSREPGRPKLSPAYDLLSTSLVIPGDQLALSVRGKKSNLDRADWIAFAEYCGLQRKLADRELDQLAALRPRATERISGCFLSADFRERLCELIEERTRAL